MMKLLQSAVALLASLAVTNACTGSAGGGGANSGTIDIGNTGIPATLPPTPAPTPPPPPPPVQYGWAPAPPRQQVQDMTRANCRKRVDFFNTGSTGSSGLGDYSEVQEGFTYICTYEIYVEVILWEAFEPTDCSCGFSYTRTVPPLESNYEQTFSTRIIDFNLVVYHRTLKKPMRVISEFSLATSDNATRELRDSLQSGLLAGLKGDNGGYNNFSSVTQGFHGRVDTIELANYPELNQTNPMNRDNIAAMCFSVEDTYTTSYRWPEPPFPFLGAYPNVYYTNCVPWYPSWSPYPDGVSKRFAQDQTVYWFRDFLSFPTRSESGVTPGFVPESRYMTSFYLENNCKYDLGVVTFDRHFTQRLARSSTINGAFDWERNITKTWIVGGVPSGFDTTLSTISGFNSVEWYEYFSKDLDKTDTAAAAYIPGKLWHFIGGSDCVPYSAEEAGSHDDACDPPFTHKFSDNALTHFQLCEEVPAAWKTCTEIGGTPGTDCGFTSDDYGEDAIYFQAHGTGEDSPLKCIESRGYIPGCTGEETFLSFQNFGSGQLARDFRKKADSVLLTGPRIAFCNEHPEYNEFDSLVYYPYDPDLEIGEVAHEKRSLNGKSRRLPKLNYKRQGNGIDTEPEEPMFGHPEAEEIMSKPGGGSANADGTAGGDHPLSLFPETYTVPVSLDPNDLEYSASRSGWSFSGAFSPCLKGTQGCSCRERVGRPACDAPLMCNEAEFCVDPPCAQGEAGCDCNSDNTCGNDNLECHAETFSCAYKQTCTPGETGCVCAGGEEGTCSDSSASCYDGFCLAFDCPPGLPGCDCNAGSCLLTSSTCEGYTEGSSAGKCAEPSFNAAKKLGAQCNPSVANSCEGTEGATCHAETMVCTGERCAEGSSGCRCNLGQCDKALDECSSLGICLTQTCEPGSGGCTCYQGQACSAGFECDNPSTDLSGVRNDRCVRERCDPGEPGCLCDISKGASEACNYEGFSCLPMLKSGEEHRCVASGSSCDGDSVARCVKFCGEGNVLRCPGCDNQVPICKVDPNNSSLFGFSALLALLAALVQLF